MRLTKGLFNSFQILLLNFTSYVRLLLPLRGVVIESINMKHILKWHPFECPCSTTASYYVQFQGEFEHMSNNSWCDAPDCQNIHHPVCNLTLDLGSDSDYDVRVRVQCEGKTSIWSKLPSPFNRRNTVLTVPAMTVIVLGNGLMVNFKDLPRTTELTVTVWDREQHPRASSQVFAVEHSPLFLDNLKEGAMFCLKAQIHLILQNRSSRPTTQCVSIPGQRGLWLKCISVFLAVLFTAGLIITVIWLVIHCDPQACKAHLRKEPLPSSLLIWPAARLSMCSVNTDHSEHIHTVLLLGPQTTIERQNQEGPEPNSLA